MPLKNAHRSLLNEDDSENEGSDNENSSTNGDDINNSDSDDNNNSGNGDNNNSDNESSDSDVQSIDGENSDSDDKMSENEESSDDSERALTGNETMPVVDVEIEPTPVLVELNIDSSLSNPSNESAGNTYYNRKEENGGGQNRGGGGQFKRGGSRGAPSRRGRGNWNPNRNNNVESFSNDQRYNDSSSKRTWQNRCNEKSKADNGSESLTGNSHVNGENSNKNSSQKQKAGGGGYNPNQKGSGNNNKVNWNNNKKDNSNNNNQKGGSNIDWSNDNQKGGNKNQKGGFSNYNINNNQTYNQKGGNNNNNHHHNQKGGNSNNNNNNNNNQKGGGINNKNKKCDDDVNNKDYLKLVKEVIRPFWNKKHQAEPVDSFVLKLHYHMSVCIFILSFVVVQSNWYLRESITCVSAHYSEGHIPFRLKNFCLSFSYICELTHGTEGTCFRRYLLFYRWIHTCFLTISAIYYLPRIVAKKVMNPRLKKLLAELSSNEAQYDNSFSKKDVEKMLKFMQCEKGTTIQYLWLILCHLIALAIDVLVIYFFNFMLNNRFLGLLYHAYPYQRNPPYFTDYLSQTFPPFVNCTVHMENLINVDREDTLGCYLYLMELYDKVFIFLWVWLVFLVIMSSLSIVILLFLPFPPWKRMFLFLFSSSPGISRLLEKVRKMSNSSDLYALYLMKKHMSEGEFILFLQKLVHSHEDTLNEVRVDSTEAGHCMAKANQNVLDPLWNEKKDPMTEICSMQSYVSSAPPFDSTTGTMHNRLIGQSVRQS